MAYATLIESVLAGTNLSETQAGEAISLIMGGECTPVQTAALLTALHARGETLDEVVGAATAMRNHAVPVDVDLDGILDTCGTGGDHSGSFNISTTAALVCAGAGVPVAKHGNRSATSKCGSIDVLEALGVNVNLDADGIRTCLNEAGMGVLFARMVHPAMKHAAPVRGELGFPTIFNFLGPLTNPARPQYQIVGISNIKAQGMYAEALQRLGSRKAWVVAGANGMDELTLTGTNAVIEITPESTKSFSIDPSDAGLEPCTLDDLKGGDASENAAIIRAILAGEDQGHKRNAVLLNAGAALMVHGKTNTLPDGVALAAHSIDKGNAMAVLEALVRVSNA